MVLVIQPKWMFLVNNGHLATHKAPPPSGSRVTRNSELATYSIEAREKTVANAAEENSGGIKEDFDLDESKREPQDIYGTKMLLYSIRKGNARVFPDRHSAVQLDVWRFLECVG